MPSIINALTASGGGVAITGDATGNLALQTAGNTAVTIDTSQNVGIGTTSPNNVMTTYRGAGVNNYIQFTNATTGTASTDGCLIGVSADDTALRLRVLEAAPMLFTTSDTERMRITSGGNLLVGTTTSYGKITTSGSLDPFSSAWTTSNSLTTTGSYGGGIALIDGSAGYLIRVQDNGNDFYIQGSATSAAVGGGVYLNDFATSWSSASDENVKDIIEPITNGLEKVSSLRAVIGKYKNEEEGKRHPFLIAQDIQAVLPEAVSIMNKGKENECLGLSYTEVIPLLVASIKELKAELDATKAEVQALKGVK